MQGFCQKCSSSRKFVINFVSLLEAVIVSELGTLLSSLRVSSHSCQPDIMRANAWPIF